MHTMTTNDDYEAVLVRGLQSSSKCPDLNPHQITVIQIEHQLHNSTPIKLLSKQKIPARKSSKTFTQVAHTFQASSKSPDFQPEKRPTGSPASTKRRRNSFFRRTEAASEQVMVVPKRTTSLREPPKYRNRPDAVSLHHRGRKLFSSIDNILALAQEPTPQQETDESQMPTRHPSISVQSEDSHATRRSIPAPEYLARASSHSIERPVTSFRRPEINTTLSWTSDETRLMEYEKIDRAHSGLRGFCKDLLPRRWCRGGHRDFFDGECDGDSVRRYRMSIPQKIGVAMIRDRNWSCFA